MRGVVRFSLVSAFLVLSSAASAETAGTVPGKWVAYVAPPPRPRSPATRLVVFVPSRAPEQGEKIPAVDAKTLVEHKCLGAWQLQWPKHAGPRGAWMPNPSGDGQWVFVPKKATRAIVPQATPDAAPDYGDEFAFCAKAPGESFSMKETAGKTVPGSWVTLVDGKRTVTIFVANTAAADGDALPDFPTQERRIQCATRLVRASADRAGKTKGAKADPRKRPAGPYGRWIPDPFGSKRWAWVPSSDAPFALRPTASPSDPPEPIKRKCSWDSAVD